MKAQMSLEYIVKILILLVVVVVVVGIILNFKDEIQVMLKSFLNKEKKPDFPQYFEKSSFSAGEISAYIESCYSTMSALPEDEQKDIVCYILQPEQGFKITKDGMLSKLSTELKNKVEITADLQSADIIKIEFNDLGNTISVRD